MLEFDSVFKTPYSDKFFTIRFPDCSLDRYINPIATEKASRTTQ